MKKERDTDTIIREKLEGFAVPPPLHIWDNVQGQLLAQKQKKRRFIYGWIAAAAVVLLAFVAGWYFNDNVNSETFSTAQNEKIENGQNNSVIQNEPAETLEETIISAQAEVESPVNSFSSILDEPISKTAINEKLIAKATVFADENTMSRKTPEINRIESIRAWIVQNTKKATLFYPKQGDLPDNNLTRDEQLLIAENVRNLATEIETENNWKMGMYVSPGYSSHVASHTESYNRQMTNSANSGNTDVSGGFSIQYKTGKKLSVESGIYYAQNGQKSENSLQLFSLNQEADRMFAPSDKSYLANAVKVENGNLQMNSTAGVIAFSGTPKGAEIAADFESLAGVPNSLISNGEFSQVFDFVEIPLYLRYRLVDSKFGVELLGGVNAGLIVGNNAYIDNEFGLQNIGETQDISTLNVSGVVGLGFNYDIGKNLSLAIEPRVNYYLNSINTNPNVDFRPYRIGFFTGVSYEF